MLNRLGNEKSALSKFLGDAEAIELFMMEMFSQSNRRGEFVTACAVGILREGFGFPQVSAAENKTLWNQPYRALYELSKSRRLEKLSFGYRIPADRFQMLSAQLAEAPSACQGRFLEGPLLPGAVDFLRQLEVFEHKAALLHTARLNLLERQAEMAAVASQIAELQRLQTSLGEDIVALEAAAADPEALEAEQVCQAIRQKWTR